MSKPIFISKNFSKIFTANSLSKLGDSMHELIFLLLVINEAKNNLSFIGIIYFLKFIPYLLFGFLGGYLADTYNNKKIMLISDMARAIMTLLMCYLAYFELSNLLILAIVAFLMTLFRIIFQPCFQATIPTIVEHVYLSRANSLMQISEEVGVILGPSLAGLLITLTNKSLVFAIDACTYLISFLLILTLSIVRDTNKWQKKFISYKSFILDTIQALKNISNNDKLLHTIVVSGICIFFVSSNIRFIIPIYIKNNFTADAQIIGFTLSAIACGTVIGAILYNKLWKISSVKKLLFFWSAYGLALLIITLVLSKNYILLIAFIMGIIGAWVDICLTTNIQTLSTNEDIGKNFSIFSTIANTSEASSGLISGIILKVTSVYFCANIFSMLVFTIPLIILFMNNQLIKRIKK